jgi:hypothetical protein
MRLLVAHEAAARRAASWYDKLIVHHRVRAHAWSGGPLRADHWAPALREDAPVADDGSKAGVRATGGCQCGGVRYRVEGPLRDVVNCHCEPCRRITGHHMAATAASVDDVHFESDATLGWYQRTAGTRYGFCTTCGSTLFWSAADKADMLSIAAGSIDQPSGLVTVVAMYADEAPDFHRLDTTIPTFGRDRPVDDPSWPVLGDEV